MFPKEKQLLPSTFAPSENTVIIGKGRAPREAPGNKKLQALVIAQVSTYSQCQERKVRAGIIRSIMETVAETCSDAEGDVPFAKFDGQRWWRVDETTIRENISAAFRNKLSDKYKSSTKHKSAKRRTLKAMKLAAKVERLTSGSSIESADSSSIYNAQHFHQQAHQQPTLAFPLEPIPITFHKQELRPSAVMTFDLLQDILDEEPTSVMPLPIIETNNNNRISNFNHPYPNMTPLVAPQSNSGVSVVSFSDDTASLSDMSSDGEEALVASWGFEERPSMLFCIDEVFNSEETPIECVNPSIFEV